MTTLAVLKGARAILSSPEKWTQGAYAKTKMGHRTLTGYEDACSFCSLGALSLAELRLPHQMGFPEAVRELEQTIERSTHSWNDAPERTFEEVIAAFDRTIARLEAQCAP